MLGIQAAKQLHTHSNMQEFMHSVKTEKSREHPLTGVQTSKVKSPIKYSHTKETHKDCKSKTN
jgi:hypothetical protein